MRITAFAALLALCCLVVGCDNDGGSGNSGASKKTSTLAITTTSLPVGLDGTPYSATVEATGGSGVGYSWTIVQGALPGGLGIQATGTPGTTVSGTPTYATYLTNFTVQVEDSLGNKATRILNLPLNSGQPGGPSVASPILLVCDVSADTAGAINSAMRTEVEQLVTGLLNTDEFDIVVHSDRFNGGYVAMWGTTLPATSGNVASALAWIQGPNFNAAGTVGDSMRAAWEFAYTSYPSVMTPAYLFHSTGAGAPDILSNLPSWAASAPNGKALFVAFTPDAATKQFGQDVAALVGGTYIES